VIAGVVISHLSADRLAELGYGNTVKCLKCGHTQEVTVSHCFRTGWPEHCEETMELQKREVTS
jgi:hypothetical protein